MVIPSEPDEETWITVTGPRDWLAPTEMALEIGGSAWAITVLGGGGVAMTPLETTSEVRLVSIEDCREFARFMAEPGSAHVVRFAPDESVGVEDWTGRGVEMGPALNETAPSDC
jgi:hypothetical protein